ncbi:unnamed protein product [Psylliodes chrysocephalus]|uniref:LRRCT domain-containing protein n=1 Tax=Psylliodes chrysocephalus TaxID=3402493 RepID=A0A9P0D1D8_9CUCU|nr:unnamed protein product [Psylliodes chrysocephala]
MLLKLLLLFVLVFCENVYSEICSNASKLKCDCRIFTNTKSHLPMQTADCSERGIENIPENIEDGLSILDLSINVIQNLDPTKQALSSNSLEELILSYNNITYIDVNFFQNLPNLQQLDLSNNFISAFNNSEVFQNLKSLNFLDLSYNNLNTLPDFIFNPLFKLIQLDLSYNYMGEFLTSSKSVLTDKLGLTSNLTQLSINGLNLMELPSGYFDKFVDLKKLSLCDNDLSVIPTVPYTLEYLDLSGNKLTFISARYLNYHSLKVLKLNEMDTLTDIHHYAFYNLFALEKLYINDCPNLKEFNELAFDVPSKDIDHHPKFLSLARNGLKSLNQSYKYFFKNMDHIDLTHNPWNCDCDILWLQDFADELSKPHELRCNYPSELKHKKILDIEPSDLLECFPAIYGKKSHRVLIVVLSLSCVVLCGLIFYLLRYPINGIANKHKIGPNSPYSLAHTTDHA